MRRIIFLQLFLLGFAFISRAQDYVPSQEDVQAFFRTKTLVVLEDNPMNLYNSWIREAVEQNWEITEFDFITYSEFDEYRKDPSYSFLITTHVTFERDRLKARYKFLNLLLGGNYGRLPEMPDLCPVPLAYLNADEENYIYKLGIFVRFIQNHVNLLKQDPKLSSSNVFRYYNDNLSAGVRHKTLYVLQQELAPEVNTKEKIAEYYTYPLEIVTQEQIVQAIRDRDDDIVFLHKVGPEGTRLKARCYKILIGAGDANFYYFDHHMIKLPRRPDGMLSRDFRKLSQR